MPPNVHQSVLDSSLDREASSTRSTSREIDVLVEHASGATVTTPSGRKYLDLTGALGTNLLGFDNPAILQAVREQLDNVVHVGWQLGTPAKSALLNGLATYFSADTTFLFASSGAEAVEGAMKIARTWHGGHSVLAFSGAFHGKSVGTLELTGSPRLRHGLTATRSGLLRLPYPTDPALGSDRAEEDALRCLEVLELLLDAPEQAREEVAGVIVEGVQGSRMNAAPLSFLRGLRRITRERGVLLIVDEVFSGCGRTGDMFSYQRAEITPDLVVLGKSLGGGFPLGLVAGPSNVMDSLGPALHTSTFSANAVACAAGAATLREIRRPEFGVAVPALRTRLNDGLAKRPQPGEGRWVLTGRGSMIGMKLTGVPDADRVCARIRTQLREQGVLVLVAGDCLRLSPPVCLTSDDVDGFIDVLDQVTREILV